jgi:hypothetical protein
MNLAIPFSLSDVLERVIPGSILLSVVLLLQTDRIDPDVWNYNAFFLLFLFLSVSYALGVLMNTLSGLWRIRDFRKYWTSTPSPRETAIRSAIEQHFGVGVDDSIWSLCYGPCVKHGYAANVQLFLGLEIFCSSMTIASAISSAILIVGAATAFLCSYPSVFSPEMKLALGVGFALAVPIFRRGTGSYSRAFVGSIYEGFYSWYCEPETENPKD